MEFCFRVEWGRWRKRVRDWSGGADAHGGTETIPSPQPTPDGVRLASTARRSISSAGCPVSVHRSREPQRGGGSVCLFADDSRIIGGARQGALMDGNRILLGVTGGIAAYKSPELVRRLRERGAQIQV